MDRATKVVQLASLVEEGLLTEEEFQQMKLELLENS